MLRCVSPLAKFALHEVINRTRSDAASDLSLGTRVGLVTASNDYQESRLTGSLPLLQKIITGVVIMVLLLFLKAVLVFVLVFPPSGGKSFQVLAAGVASVCFGCGCTMRPIAQTNPANSRASAAAATGDFFLMSVRRRERAGPVDRHPAGRSSPGRPARVEFSRARR